MSHDSSQAPILVDFYEQYLVDQDNADYIQRVTQRYTIPTLERLAEWGPRMARRGSVLALGMAADYTSNAVLGRALVDQDRGVRTLADAGIRNLWVRLGTDDQQSTLRQAVTWIASKRFEEAIHATTKLIHDCPWYAEAWNQRALAHFNRTEYDESIRDCHQALEINPYHFPAATGMGKCYLQLTNRVAALESFRRALRLNPGLDDVRAHVVFLQRALKEE